MSKFKEGDKVKIVSCLQSTYRYANKIGQEFILDKYSPIFGWNTKEDYYSYLDECDIEIVQEKEMFDMKKQPWFIRVNNKEEFEAVKKWVKSQGFSFAYSEEYAKETIAIGVHHNIDISNFHLYKQIHNIWKETLKQHYQSNNEIKLNFKTVVDSVEYPVVKSERDLKIEELEQSIKEAQERLNELKEMK